jgi:hypothetical protein
LELAALVVGEPVPQLRPASSEADNGEPHAKPSEAPCSADAAPERPPPNGADNYRADGRRNERHARTDGNAQASDLITEGSVAAAFAHEYRARLRYCHHAGAWFLWDKTRWKREETKLAYRWAHQQAKALAADAENARAIVTAGTPPSRQVSSGWLNPIALSPSQAKYGTPTRGCSERQTVQ